jgi:preprotein translocase subunit SecA
LKREVLLKTLDTLWKDHLVNMNKLSSAVISVFPLDVHSPL